MTKKIDIEKLDYTMALLIKPLLVQYKEENTHIPNMFFHYSDPLSEWHSRLDKMIDAFDCIINLEGERPSAHDAIYVVYNGLKLFSEHYLDF